MDGAVRHSTLKIGRVTVFYREAGLEGSPVLLLLHGSQTHRTTFGT
jgi:hypothetical protein